MTYGGYRGATDIETWTWFDGINDKVFWMDPDLEPEFAEPGNMTPIDQVIFQHICAGIRGAACDDGADRKFIESFC